MMASDFGPPLDLACPYCGCNHLEHTVERQPVRFSYGPDELLMATVEVEVPVTTCTGCRQAWTDARAEAIRQEAVERRRDELRA